MLHFIKRSGALYIFLDGFLLPLPGMRNCVGGRRKQASPNRRHFFVAHFARAPLPWTVDFAVSNTKTNVYCVEKHVLILSPRTAILLPDGWHILHLRRTTEAFVDGNTSPWSDCPSVAGPTTPPTAWPTNARLISAVSAGIKGLLAGRAAAADALRELVS